MAENESDQAAGLRRLFRPRLAPAAVIFSGRDAREGNRILGLCAQAAAARGLNAASMRLAGGAGTDALQGLRREHDLVLVEAAGEADAALVAAPGVKAVFAVTASAEAITLAYAGMKRLAATLAGAPAGVVMMKGADGLRARAAFDNMQRLGERQLAVRLRWLGWIPAAALAPGTEELACSRLAGAAEQVGRRLIDDLLPAAPTGGGAPWRGQGRPQVGVRLHGAAGRRASNEAVLFD